MSIYLTIKRRIEEDGLIPVLMMATGKVFARFYAQLMRPRLRLHRASIHPRSTIRGLRHIRIGAGFSAGEGLWLEAISRHGSQLLDPQVVIGSDVRLSQWVHVSATHFVEIGDGVLIGSRVFIADHNHGIYTGEFSSSPETSPSIRPLDDDKSVIIGRNVWIGDGVVVTPGTIIGDGSVIGANSVVRGTVPKNCIAVGAPARVVKRWEEGSGWIVAQPERVIGED